MVIGLETACVVQEVMIVGGAVGHLGLWNCLVCNWVDRLVFYEQRKVM
jgi:hypothetical protein